MNPIPKKAVKYISNWCEANFLGLNVTKTKEFVIDFRVNKNEKEPIIIGNQEVEIVHDYKYLGSIYSDDLRWEKHIQTQIKKANRRMYYVRCLCKLKVDKTIITMFYNSTIASVLSYAISVWFSCCTKQDRVDLDKIRKNASKLIGADLVDLQSAYDSRSAAMRDKIMKDSKHPLHNLYKWLPSGRRLSSIKQRTARFGNTFIPSGIRSFNNSSKILI